MVGLFLDQPALGFIQITGECRQVCGLRHRQRVAHEIELIPDGSRLELIDPLKAIEIRDRLQGAVEYKAHELQIALGHFRADGGTRRTAKSERNSPAGPGQILVGLLPLPDGGLPPHDDDDGGHREDDGDRAGNAPERRRLNVMARDRRHDGRQEPHQRWRQHVAGGEPHQERREKHSQCERGHRQTRQRLPAASRGGEESPAGNEKTQSEHLPRRRSNRRQDETQCENTKINAAYRAMRRCVPDRTDCAGPAAAKDRLSAASRMTCKAPSRVRRCGRSARLAHFTLHCKAPGQKNTLRSPG